MATATIAADLEASLRDIERHASSEDKHRTMVVVQALLDGHVTVQQVNQACRRGTKAARTFADSIRIKFGY